MADGTVSQAGWHPEAAQIAALIAAADAPAIDTMTPVEARVAARGFSAFAAPPAAVRSADDITLAADGRDIQARLYRPLEERPGMAGAALLFFHGGGWVVCDLDSHDDVCRALCRALGCAVLSVEYRLAPEHPFPAAVEDAFASLRWLAEQAPALGIDASRIMVAGDSAGGNLAAVTAIAAARGIVPPVAFQMLFYPVTDLADEAPSYARCEEGLALTSSAMRWMRELYAPAGTDRSDWRLSPAKASDVGAVAPAFVLTVQHDPLCDEGIAYARRLAAEGAVVTHVHMAGHMHGLVSMGGVLRDAAAAIAMAAAAAGAMLAPNDEERGS